MSKKILIVDDDANLHGSLRRQLGRGYDVILASSGAEGLRLLETEGPIAVIVSDYRMPGMDGVTFLSQAKRISPDSVSVMLTAWGDLELIVSALHEAGIYRFLSKPCPASLMEATLLDCLEQHRLVTQERQLMAELKAINLELSERNEQLERVSSRLVDTNLELERLARIDPLTDMLNRRAWIDVALMQQQLAKRQDLVFGVIMVDVDHFKAYNDTFGHQAGDECLRLVARAIGSTARGSDACGRYGGEEFIVACVQEEPAGVARFAERLREAVASLGLPHPRNADAGHVTVSVGCTNGTEDDWETLAKRADEALYAAKRAGRNRACEWTNSLVGSA